MTLRDYDYVDNHPTGTGALTRLAPMIEAVRDSGGTTLLFDAGDTLQGQPTGDMLAREFAQGAVDPHPMIEAMNTLSYDAAIAGNHDLNFGIDFARHAFAQANFPYVLSHGPLGERLGFVRRSLLKRSVADSSGTRHTVNIGVIGLLPPGVLAKSDVGAEYLQASRQIREQVEDQIQTLRRNGADLIVALTHSGTNETQGTAFVDQSVLPLANMPGVDVVIGGHTHQVFPPDTSEPTSSRDAVQGPAVIQAGYGGAHLGKVDLTLECGAQGWRPATTTVDVISVADQPAPESPQLIKLSQKLHDRTVAALCQPVSQLTRSMHNYFAALGHDRCGAVVGQAKIAFARQIAQGLGLEDLPVLALTSPYRAGGRDAPHFVEVEQGPLLARHLFAMHPFPDRLCLLRLTRQQVVEIASATARKFNNILPNITDQKLTAETVPCYEIETFRGLTCTLDLGARSDARLVDIDLHGGAFTQTDTFLVATTDFRAAALGLEPHVVFQSDQTLPELLRARLEAQHTITPAAPPGWIFAPVLGASVKLRTGIGARQHLGDIAAYHPQDLGTDARGFLWLRIHLDPQK